MKVCLFGELGNVSPLGDEGPVSSQNCRCVFIDFYLPFAFEAGLFESEFDTADAGEERTEGESAHWSPLALR